MSCANTEVSIKIVVDNDSPNESTALRKDDSWEFFINKIGHGPKVTYGPWNQKDPCGHGSYTITLSHLSDLSPLDCIWSFQIVAQDGAHPIERVTVAYYCDMDADCPSAAHNGPLPIEVYPVPANFAASWNAYVAFRLYRHCRPHSSS